MVRPEVIRKRLNKLDEYLNILKNIRRYTLDEFLADPERYGSAERFLQLVQRDCADYGQVGRVPRVRSQACFASPSMSSQWPLSIQPAINPATSG